MPIKIGRDGIVPKCLDMISVKMVIDRITFHFDGGAYFYDGVPFKIPAPFQEPPKSDAKKESKTDTNKTPKKDAHPNLGVQESGEPHPELVRSE
jgi:hypothetical protein